MNVKPRRARGALAGSEIVGLAVDSFRYTAQPQALQASKLSSQFGLSPVAAAAVAELAFPTLDDWRARA